MKGISVIPDPDMSARWSHVMAPLSEVLPILAGEVMPSDRWVIGSRLMQRVTAMKELGFSFDPDKWEIAPASTKPNWPLILEVVLWLPTRSITFRVTGPDGIACQQDVPFMLTHRGDATQVVALGTAPAASLIEGHVFEVPDTVESLRDLDVWLPEFRLAKIWVGVEETVNAAPLPGGPDLMLAVPGDASEPCLRIAQERRRLVLRLVEGGGPRYRRTPPPALSVMLCPPGDPSVVLAGWTVPMDDLLKKGMASVPLPKKAKGTDVMVNRVWTTVVRA